MSSGIVSSLRDNWTRDANGDYVDWTRPPYRSPGSGILMLVLEGEIAYQLAHEIRVQRILEYYALLRREARK